jgi:hypothetical protein
LLEPWAAGVMFRSAVIAGDKALMAEWASTYASGAPFPPSSELLADMQRDRVLLLDELRIVHRDRETLESTWGRSTEQVERIFRSFIASAQPDDREAIRYWTRRLVAVRT